MNLSPSEVYELSFHELNCYIESYAEQNTSLLEYDKQKIKFQSWLTAGLVLSGLGGKFPSFDEISREKTQTNEIDINDQSRLLASLEVRAILSNVKNTSNTSNTGGE